MSVRAENNERDFCVRLEVSLKAFLKREWYSKKRQLD